LGTEKDLAGDATHVRNVEEGIPKDLRRFDVIWPQIGEGTAAQMGGMGEGSDRLHETSVILQINRIGFQ
jgi:hypothetical protein